MGSKGFILLGLLFVLSVLCHSGYSLQCYRCLNPGGMCTNIFNCTPDSDACLSLFGGKCLPLPFPKYKGVMRAWEKGLCPSAPHAPRIQQVTATVE
ncbi:hypothetical protein HJG60_011348 [Phyllostomus discolor]|uniref:Uncharacterized protein n=1 Tax=Phyllostomus discolor TaxID=89673 RepID=A0A834A2I1_9CHIR|nr:hypothetical protein HJG60_011348 [Phyllostomus discolor]